ncbi:TspO/MBR family-domain-containing protein [Cristinia sonorae]|uniref:TspO/MBR family-domain-containing protein n=1 Tax=Cristinia sonorae TaxID=1940300 RepID=A0A8K0UY28_9AGAR|nr:TspO/MBR family-domain-containing protein [Cristinia sonorae]
MLNINLHFPVHLPNVLLHVPRNVALAVGVPLVFGMLSGAPTSQEVKRHWYNSLHFPRGRPPPAAFPFIWSTLYMSIGYASHLAAKTFDASSSPEAKAALSKGLLVYFVQLGLNLGWTSLFFVKHKVGLALVDSIMITGMSLYMTKLFHTPTSGKSTWFLAPYCAWLVYATYLNAGIWHLNRNRYLREDDDEYSSKKDV